MKRRIGLLIALILWVMIGKAMAHSDTDRRTQASIEEQSVKSEASQSGDTVNSPSDVK